MYGVQLERCRRIAMNKGFDERQDKLVESCEGMIEAAQGDDWNEFLTALAELVIITEQVRLLLDEENAVTFNARLNSGVVRQFAGIGGRDWFV